MPHSSFPSSRKTLAASALASAVVLAFIAAPPAHGEATASQPGSVFSETLESGGELRVFVPDSPSTGLRAASTPILLVLADSALSAAQTREVAEESGLASLAQEEQGVVAFLNPVGEEWSSEDVDGVRDVLDRFGDSTGSPYSENGQLCSDDGESCVYPGSRSRAYVFADGRGADFVHTHVVSGVPWVFELMGTDQVWTPAAVYSSNATEPAVAPGVDTEVPAFAVNASLAVQQSLRVLSPGTGLFGSASSPVVDGFDPDALLQGYDAIIEHARQRQAPFTYDHGLAYSVSDFAERGLSVDHGVFNGENSAFDYFVYTPQSTSSAKIPVVLTFHGGGNHAEYQVWAAGWDIVAAKYGVEVVSINHANASPTDIITLLDSLLAADDRLDASRVYASGFSMGAVKTWSLFEQYGERFAGVAPTNGSFAPEATPGLGSKIPAIYFAGRTSELPEFPHQWGEANNIDLRIASLFAQNGVGEYAFDPAAGSAWGAAPSRTFTVENRWFPESTVDVSLYASADGSEVTALAIVNKAEHEILPVMADTAWRFLSRFSRAADGTLQQGVQAGITVEATVAPDAEGALSLTVAENDGVRLEQSGVGGDRLRFEGELPSVRVNDSRNAAQAAGGGWEVAGRSSSFTTTQGSQLGAAHLGWSPLLTQPKAGVKLGKQVATALDSADGLATSRRLAIAGVDGRFGTTELGARLRLDAPLDAEAGTYVGTVSLSLFPVD